MDRSYALQLSGSRSFIFGTFGCQSKDLIDFISYSQILEYMGGGDLLNLLIEQDVFEEDFTRFYVAEVRACGTFL